jgi:hypothetical protein
METVRRRGRLDAPVRSDFLAQNGSAPAVVFDVLTDLHLEKVQALTDVLAAKGANLVVGVSEPSRGRGVGREPVAEHLRLSGRFARDLLTQEFESLLAGEGIRDPVEIDTVNQLLRGHVRQELPAGKRQGQVQQTEDISRGYVPERLALDLGEQIPNGVDDGTNSHVPDSLLGADPAQLRFGRQRSDELDPVAGDAVEGLADDVRDVGLDALGDDLAACDRVVGDLLNGIRGRA